MIDLHINQYEYLQHNYALLLTIPGVGPVVSRYMLIVIGSRTFKSASQCAAYIGLVPIQNESGSSLKGRSRLAKAGNPVQVILNWLELDKVFGALSHQKKYALIFALQHTMRSF
jgi:hypothetical protein